MCREDDLSEDEGNKKNGFLEIVLRVAKFGKASRKGAWRQEYNGALVLGNLWRRTKKDEET